MSSRRFRGMIVLGALASLASATRAPAQTLRFVATDYAFRGPTTARPGIHRIVLVNHGRDVHHLVVSTIPDTLNAARLYEMLVKGAPTPDDIADVGGPNATSPGDSTSAIVRLEPGRYMLDCWVRAPDGALHVMKGMFGQLDVAGPVTADAEPGTDLLITAREYELSLSRPLRAGTQVIRFENAGRQEHDLQIVRLAPGTQAMTATRRLNGDTTGSGFRFVGGLSGIAPHHHAWTRVTLTPGRYAIFCFVTDDKGTFHADLGMVTEMTVRQR